jgi:3-deoxy-manno-octulosonate cytidylyltransferase (CMP-KDO synthetase)
MTRTEHATGSDRAAEIARQLNCDYVVNIQGDEPFISADTIDCVAGLLDNDEVVMSTACSAIDVSEVSNPNIVKVVLGGNRDALYFSRSAIPFARNTAAFGQYYRHIGIYGFKRDFLLKFASLPRPPSKKQRVWSSFEAGTRFQDKSLSSKPN